MKGGRRQCLEHPSHTFGGKSKIAPLVWSRLGDVSNYIEPFFGSGAMLLARPHEPNIETVNDKDALLCNFWRALQFAPDEVFKWADWPVNQIDLHARHKFLLDKRTWVEELLSDPMAYDAQLAGWWAWGIGQWIGKGWGQKNTPDTIPFMSRYGMGIHTKVLRDPEKKKAYLYILADRLRHVRVCSGEWIKVLGPGTVQHKGLTGIFLDPPYMSHDRKKNLYAHDEDIAKEVQDWAIAHGDDPNIRIALCGYDGHYSQFPDNWSHVIWKANMGFASGGKGATRGKENRSRETIWFSPHCLRNI